MTQNRSDWHAEIALALVKKAWKRVGGDDMNVDAPYLFGHEGRMEVLATAQVHAILSLRQT